MYGKVVNYGINIDTSLNDCWKIFYADSTNIYLITDSYVNVSLLPQKDLNSISYSYISDSANFKARFGNHIDDNTAPNDGIFPLYSSVNKNDFQEFNKEFYNSFKDIDEAWNTPNVIAVNSLIDTNFWLNLVDENAEYAIGGPTIEMLFNSYNKKYNYEYEYQAYKKTRGGGYLNAYGYQMRRNSSEGWNYWCGLSNIEDSLYVSEKQANNAYGYWIASPGCNYALQLLGVSNRGMIGQWEDDEDYYDLSCCDRFGFRPVVCLKSSKRLIEQQDGTFNIK